MQATCEEEMHYYREMGFTNPVAIIPNPVELEPLANDVSKQMISSVLDTSAVFIRENI